MAAPSLTAQDDFIKQIKDKAAKSAGPVEFIHNPPAVVYNGQGRLDVRMSYYKPILLCAPHFNFPNIKIPCGNINCNGHFRPTQWAEPRNIHGMSGQVSLLQFRYACDGCRKSLVTSELLKTARCPEIVRLSTEAQYFLTYNSGVTGDVLEYINNDAMSPKSYDDIQLGLVSFRKHRYIQKRAEYEVARDYGKQP